MGTFLYPIRAFHWFKNLLGFVIFAFFAVNEVIYPKHYKGGQS